MVMWKQIISEVFGTYDLVGMNSFKAGTLPSGELRGDEEDRLKLGDLAGDGRSIRLVNYESGPTKEDASCVDHCGKGRDIGYMVGEGGNPESGGTGEWAIAPFVCDD